VQHLFPSESKVTARQRQQLLSQSPKVIWFTGLSCSGKSTLAAGLEVLLHERKYKTFVLDGDNLRAGLNKDLGFSDGDRQENLRRVAEVARLFVDAGVVVLAAFITPFEESRQSIRQIVGPQNYLEVFVDCPMAVCEERDSKGLYRKARAGEVKNFTGIDSPYERPSQPDIIIASNKQTVRESLNLLLDFIEPRLTVS
jgi:adenylylsulfate kinase